MASDSPAGTSIVLRFDMRSSPDCSEPQTARYQAAIDMALLDLASGAPTPNPGLFEQQVLPEQPGKTPSSAKQFTA